MTDPSPIYLDNHATTPVDPRVVEAMLPYFSKRFGDASSPGHVFGREAAEAVARAREQVAGCIGAGSPEEIVFTSGATESDNLALKGVAEAYAGRGAHIVTSAIEHRAVLESCRHLECHGFEVTVVPVGSDGIVDPGAIAQKINERTFLVSVMLANHEVGTLQAIDEVGAITRAMGVLLHTDASQALGRVPFDVEAARVDLASISGHKIHGPKGVGALYVRRSDPRMKLIAQIDGEGQEHSVRSGTLNVPAIVGLGKACEIMAREGPAETELIRGLRNRLRRRLRASLEGVLENGDPERRLAGNLNVSFQGVPSDALMKALPDVVISSGTPCTGASIDTSSVLRALGIDDERARCSIRFGVGRFNDEEEIDRAADAVVQAVTVHRQRSPSCGLDVEQAKSTA